jgi:hypothetical protein
MLNISFSSRSSRAVLFFTLCVIALLPFAVRSQNHQHSPQLIEGKASGFNLEPGYASRGGVAGVICCEVESDSV